MYQDSWDMKTLLLTITAGALFAASTGLAAPIHNAAHKGASWQDEEEKKEAADLLRKNGAKAAKDIKF